MSLSWDGEQKASMPLAALRNSSSSSGSRVLRVSWRELFLHVFTLICYIDMLYKVAINKCVHLFQGRLLSRYRFVLKNADCFQDVFLQTVLRLLKAIPGQSLGLGVSLCVGLGGCLGQGQR